MNKAWINRGVVDELGTNYTLVLDYRKPERTVLRMSAPIFTSKLRGLPAMRLQRRFYTSRRLQAALQEATVEEVEAMPMRDYSDDISTSRLCKCSYRSASLLSTVIIEDSIDLGKFPG